MATDHLTVHRPLTRLRHCAPGHAMPPNPGGSLPSANAPAPPADNYLERCIGNVVHLALEELSRRPALPTKASDQDEHRWRRALQRLGLWGAELETALRAVLDSLVQSLRPAGDGPWVLAAGHTEAYSEWALTTVDAQGQIRDIRIDRSFIDPATGERWVIDYKNSRPTPGEPLHEFTARQSVACFDQLQRYRDAVRELTSVPLRCALYFTALGHLHAVPELALPALEITTEP